MYTVGLELKKDGDPLTTMKRRLNVLTSYRLQTGNLLSHITHIVWFEHC